LIIDVGLDLVGVIGLESNGAGVEIIEGLSDIVERFVAVTITFLLGELVIVVTSFFSGDVCLDFYGENTYEIYVTLVFYS